MTDIAVSALTVGCVLPLVFLLIALVWTGIRSGWRGGYSPPSFEEWKKTHRSGCVRTHPWPPPPPPDPLQKKLCYAVPEFFEELRKKHPDWTMDMPLCRLEHGHEGSHVSGDNKWDDGSTVRTQVRFELPDHLLDVAQMILEKNNAGPGEKWTLDEMCRRWVCEMLRQERDKAPDFGKGLKDENVQ